MEHLFNPTSILLHMFNAALLLVAVYFLLLKPVRKFLAAREERVASQLDGAARIEEQAKALLETRKRQLDGAAAEVAEMLKSGEARGKECADELLVQARNDARQIEDKARTRAASLESSAQAALYEKAAQLSIEIARTVLAREVTLDDHKRLLAEFVEKAGEAR